MSPPAAKGLRKAPIVKFLPDEVLAKILTRTGAENGDLLFFGADSAKVVNDAHGRLRIRLGHDLGLVKGEWAPLVGRQFPDVRVGRARPTLECLAPSLHRATHR